MNRFILFFLVLSCCQPPKETLINAVQPANVLEYAAKVEHPDVREALVFSDQGAWFGYSLPLDPKDFGGFVGPFLMTQENGQWLSEQFIRLVISDTTTELDWTKAKVELNSYGSHLEKIAQFEKLEVIQQLFFKDSHEAILITTLNNLGEVPAVFNLEWSGRTFLDGIDLEIDAQAIQISSQKTTAQGRLQFNEDTEVILRGSQEYLAKQTIKLGAGASKSIIVTQGFSFSGHSSGPLTTEVARNLFASRIQEKDTQFELLKSRLPSANRTEKHIILLTKALLSLQNNWRAAAGELQHSGLFPSYHYKWFHGFWAWDSWKHAVALAQYDPELAKEQVRAMYSFIDEDGFIPDCVYRDTTIEAHNYRNTKPPLSGWAVERIFKADNDLNFIREIYPLLVRQHEWWYKYRDHDGDSLCEYGSTDGSLIAAKWESGMDNAVRFDNSQILMNSSAAYSLDQESVDLNAYLYAEKKILASLAAIQGMDETEKRFTKDANELKLKIQQQFFDSETGWFYDTDIAGKAYIKVMGCEGWLPLWAGVASKEQAAAVKLNMMDTATFNTMVPLQTLAANHPKFKPDGGYWRGPTWLDQAYFGIRGLKNYGFETDAEQLTNQLMFGAAGLLEKGPSIRENYHPITGEGLEAENFSWSAAHYLLLLLDI